MSDRLVIKFEPEKISTGDDDNLNQVAFLSKLAQKYEDKDDGWMSLLRAHALYISCALRDSVNNQRWQERAFKIQLKFWKSDLQSFPDHLKLIKRLKAQLRKIRGERQLEMKSIADLFQKLNCQPDNLDCPQNQDLYKEILDKIPDISAAINRDMVLFTNTIVQEALKICVPPCGSQFCVVGMGSMAKEETTPYSDLEFLFLINECSPSTVQYFENLAVTIYFLIGSLGETKLKYMAIPELMTWSSEQEKYVGHWFNDNASTSGFKIDGIGSWAGNIPTGGDDPEQHNQFICTVDQLAKRYKSVFDNPLKTSIRGDFSALLASTIYLFGDKQLHDDFRSKIQSYKPNKKREEATLNMLKNDLKQYSFQPDEELTHTRHLKSDIYRYPSILLYNLKILHGVTESNPWRVIEALQSKNVISASTAQYLQFSLCCALTIRLSAYFYHQSQDESISVLSVDPENNLYKGAWYVRPALLTHMFLHLVPLKAAVAEVFLSSDQKTKIDVQLTPVMKSETLALVYFHCEHHPKVLQVLKMAGYPKDLEPINIPTLQNYIFSAINCNEFAEVEQLLLDRTQSKQYDATDFYLLGLLYRAQCKFYEAQDCWETTFAILISENSNPGKIFGALYELATSLIDRSLFREALSVCNNCLANVYKHFGEKNHMHKVKVLASMGVAHAADGRYEHALAVEGAALTMLDKLCGNRDHPAKATILHNAASALVALSRNNEALQVLNNCLTIRRRLFDNKEHQDIVATLNSIAVVLLNQGRYEHALKTLEECYSMRNKIYKNSLDKGTAILLTNIGTCFSKLHNYPKAFIMMKQSLTVFRQLFPGKDHTDIAQALNNLGLVNLKLGKIEDGMEMFKESLAMTSRIHHGADHLGMFRALANIGNALMDSRHYKKALGMHTQAFLMLKRLVLNRDHEYLAAALNNIGLALSTLDLSNEALFCLRQCLAMRLRLFGNINHPDIAGVLANIGIVLEEQGLFSRALLTLRRSLDMTKILSGDRPNLDLAKIHKNIGDILLATGHAEGALSHYNTSLVLIVQVFGPGNHQYVEKIKHDVGIALCFVNTMKFVATIKLK